MYIWLKVYFMIENLTITWKYSQPISQFPNQSCNWRCQSFVKSTVMYLIKLQKHPTSYTTPFSSASSVYFFLRCPIVFHLLLIVSLLSFGENVICDSSYTIGMSSMVDLTVATSFPLLIFWVVFFLLPFLTFIWQYFMFIQAFLGI